MHDPLILPGLAARAALIRGIDTMADLLRPTLGPAARTVAVAPNIGKDAPEILDSAATIARRTIQLALPFEDMGAMLLRHAVWKVFETVGDGTGTTAVLTHGLVHAAAPYLATGGSPTPIVRGIERALAVAREEIRRQARPLELPEEIAGLVAGIVRDPELSAMIAEIFDSTGPDGAVLVEDAATGTTSYEYVDGVHWNEGYASPFLLQPDVTMPRLLDLRIFVTDYVLDRAEQLVPVVEACVQAGERRLLVVAPEIRDSALALLIVNRDRGLLDGVLAVKAPGIGAQRAAILEDIAASTGGRCLHAEWHERLEQVTIDDLGRARQAWATRFAFGILGGQGSKAAIRQRIAVARAELSTVKDDEYTRAKIRERIGKLAGTAAVIRVGAATPRAQAELKARVEAAVTVARSALAEGVVPGGGAAFLGCVAAIEAIELADEERVGARCLIHALHAPMRQIARNAGFEPGAVLEQMRLLPAGWTFDVVHGKAVDAATAGIVDALTVVLAVLETSVSTARTALTIEVLIRHRDPVQAVRP